jgi:hypothetical protein
MRWKRSCVLLKKIRKTLQHYEEQGRINNMRAQVKFEWRQLQEPEGYQDPAYVIKNALQAAGYSVARLPDVQGVWDEDKPAHLGGPWDETRLPHEEITNE